MYPLLKINLNKFQENVDSISRLCASHHISIMAVTKVFCADKKLVEIFNKSNIQYIADSRLDNLRGITTDKEKVLLRLPSLHELEDVVKIADISLNSEFETIRRINETAKNLNKKHKVLLMIDIGDLREGIYHKENIVNIVRDIQTFQYVDLIGIGTNVTCYGGIIPNKNTLGKLIEIIELIKQTMDIDFTLISGGNSSHIHLLKDNYAIPYINNLRIGEAFVLGRETAYGENIENTHQDVFTLEADLIEIKFKPSIPEGEIGMNAFGERPTFEDFGLMKRGILAIGRQDVDFHELMPYDNQLRFVGSSSDHIIVDLTHTDKDYEVGDVIKFKVSYGSLLSLMTSKYVRKVYVE